MKLETTKNPVTGEDMVKLSDLNLMMVDMAEKAIKNAAEPFHKKAMDSVSAIDELLKGFGGAVENLDPIKSNLIETLRAARFATQSEVKYIKQGVEDVISLTESEGFAKGLNDLEKLSDVLDKLNKIKSEKLFDKIITLLINEPGE